MSSEQSEPVSVVTYTTTLFHCEQKMHCYDSHIVKDDFGTYRNRYWICRICGVKGKSSDKIGHPE